MRVDRIAGSKKSPPSDNKTAVLILHGMLDASPTWVVAGPKKALGIQIRYQIDHSLFSFTSFFLNCKYVLDKGKFKIGICVDEITY